MSAHDSGGTSVGGGGNALPGPPAATASAAAFVRAMRALRQWTGLTYRQLQSRAQTVGDVLPHSTLAAVLGRNTLPREELLRAFVRACGGSEQSIEDWVTIRRSIAARIEEPVAEGADHTDAAVVPSADEPNVPAAPAEMPAPAAGRRWRIRQRRRKILSRRTESDGRRRRPSAVEPAEPDRVGPSGGRRTQPSPRPGRRDGTAAAVPRTGVHRRDPAVDVPRPAGLRWLIPPIMYRTGWAARVLSGALVLILILISVGSGAAVYPPRSRRRLHPGIEGSEALDEIAEGHRRTGAGRDAGSCPGRTRVQRPDTPRQRPPPRARRSARAPSGVRRVGRPPQRRRRRRTGRRTGTATAPAAAGR